MTAQPSPAKIAELSAEHARLREAARKAQHDRTVARRAARRAAQELEEFERRCVALGIRFVSGSASAQTEGGHSDGRNED